MKFFNRCFIIVFSMIVFSVLLFCSCKENSARNSGGITTGDSSIISYCAKEKTAKNRICFNYPQLTEKAAHATELNALIIGFIQSALNEVCEEGFNGNLKDLCENWEWENSSYTLQAMNIDYKITRYDNYYFSVIFEGLYNYKPAAHPINYFNSLTLDLKKCVVVTLSDLYNLDTDFVELFKEKYKDQVRDGLAEKMGVSLNEIPEFVEEMLSSQDSSFLIESLHQANKDSDYGFYGFLTDVALGISVPLEHALGGHFEIMIDYDELEPIRR